MQQIPELIKDKLRILQSSSKLVTQQIAKQLLSSLNTTKESLKQTIHQNKAELSTWLWCGATIAWVLIALDIVVTLAWESDDTTELFLGIIAWIYWTFTIVLFAKWIIGEKEE